ncbi:N-6 DNA methylase [Clostridium sp. LQ25]|uniref:N-6 DNA methylase n=1 Tax=Clostridium sp. LQ25 TaxID=2992805 RepID=UPI00224F8FBD|nr:N-6 DNA methylase [Clostridium sp. LQ25]UZT06197.1 N-6 DNA methylase [Clostridium sp. LQ25]
MKRVKQCNDNIINVLKQEENLKDVELIVYKYLTLGYCSIKRIYKEVDIERIINSQDIKASVDESFDYMNTNIDELKGVMELIDDSNLSGDKIGKILVILQNSFFSEEDYRMAFEDVINRVTEIFGNERGENATPEFINKLTVEIIEPKEGSFYDGTFGKGGDALEAYRFAESYGNELKIFGQEISIEAVAIAKMRMYINNVKSVDIRVGDTLIAPLLVEENTSINKFKSIIMDIPFGLQWKNRQGEILNDKYERFIYGIPGVSSADWLFISTMIKLLESDGKGAIVIPSGALFRAGAEENIRKRLIGFDYIDSVITLANGLYPGTATQTAIIVFNMNKEEQYKGKIHFINAENIYENVRRGKNILSEKNINEILDIYRNRKIVENISSLINISELDGGNLFPARYIQKTEFYTEEFGKINMKLDNFKPNKKLEDIADLYRGINVTNKNIQDDNGKYQIINLADIKNNKINIDDIPRYKIENNARVEAYRVEAGDIIISNRGPLKICIIPEHEGNVLISQNFIGLRLKHGINVEYVKEFLQSPLGQYLIDSKKSGTVIATINIKELKQLPIFLKESQEQEEIISKYKKEENDIITQIEELEKQLKQLKVKLYQDMEIKNTF